MRPRVTTIILAFGAEPWLEAAVGSAFASDAVDVDVVVVDNGSPEVEGLRARDGLTIVRPGRNLGYAEGCNVGASAARGELLAFVNSDAVLEPEALAALARVLEDPSVGIATASVRLGDDPDTINSAGNPVCMLGIAWAGGLGRPAAEFADARDVASASGAAMMLRRDVWNALDGFDALYFAYHEDADLSIRCWQRGLRVRYVPDAVVAHHYEFSRNPDKLYLLERNRLMTLLVDLQPRSLLILGPVLLTFELAVLIVSLLQGWAPQKVSGWRWLVRNRRHLRERRRAVAGARVVGDREVLAHWTGRVEPGAGLLPRWASPLNLPLTAYWTLARRLL